jgi:hypothetical protein
MRLHHHVDPAQKATKYATRQLQRQQGDRICFLCASSLRRAPWLVKEWSWDGLEELKRPLRVLERRLEWTGLMAESMAIYRVCSVYICVGIYRYVLYVFIQCLVGWGTSRWGSMSLTDCGLSSYTVRRSAGTWWSKILGIIIEGWKKRKSWRSDVEAPYRYWTEDLPFRRAASWDF